MRIFTGTIWKKIQTADVFSLIWSDGTSAPGSSLNLGATTSFNASATGLNNTPSGRNALGGSSNTGIYAGTSAGKGGIYTGTSGNMRYVELQIGRLSAGTYDVYGTRRNTNTNSTDSQNPFLAGASSTGDIDVGTLEAAQCLNFGVVGSGGELRGFQNPLQIVRGPEPSAVVLLLGGLGVLATRRRC